MPSWVPSSSMTRTSRTRMRSLVRIKRLSIQSSAVAAGCQKYSRWVRNRARLSSRADRAPLLFCHPERSSLVAERAASRSREHAVRRRGLMVGANSRSLHLPRLFLRTGAGSVGMTTKNRSVTAEICGDVGPSPVGTKPGRGRFNACHPANAFLRGREVHRQSVVRS